MQTDREIIEEARKAMGEYICADMDLSTAILQLVQEYKQVCRTKSLFQRELNAAEKELDQLQSKVDRIEDIIKE